jgi:hypothetical protein
MPPSTPDEKPWVQVAYRDLLWLASLGRPLTHGAAVNAVQAARRSLGLLPYAGGRASDLVQRFTKGYALFERHGGVPLFLKAGPNQLMPVARNWKADWRLLYAPRHDAVRAIADSGSLGLVSATTAVPAGDAVWHFRPHDPVLPEINVVVGVGEATAAELARFVAGRNAQGPSRRFLRGLPGVYLYSRDNRLYVGQTEEVTTRERSHRRIGAMDWFAFSTPVTEERAPDANVTSATEALLIQFWGEVTPMMNRCGGTDSAPETLTDLRVAAGLATSAAAALLRLHRDDAGVTLPVHPKLVPGYFQLGGSPLPAPAAAKAAASARRRLERDPASVPGESS